MEYVGEVLDEKQFRKRAKRYAKDDMQHFYFMALTTEQVVDASMKGNISRFINHSCDPNSETQKVRFLRRLNIVELFPNYRLSISVDRQWRSSRGLFHPSRRGQG